MVAIPQWDRVVWRSRNGIAWCKATADLRLTSHAWEAWVLPLYDAREGAIL